MAFGPGERDGFAVGQNNHQEATLEIPPVLVQVIHEVYQFFEVGRGGLSTCEIVKEKNIFYKGVVRGKEEEDGPAWVAGRTRIFLNSWG